MKRILMGLLGGILILTACGGTPNTNVREASIPPTETKSVSTTPSPLPSGTPRERPNEPTNTPLPPTPLPTIPTFTPTFDASTIVTVTPAMKAECPETKPYPNPSLDLFGLTNDKNLEDTEKIILELLNNYDSAPLVKAAQDFWGNPEEHVVFQDFTNDGLPEIAMGVNAFYIFGCKNGHYETLLSIPPDTYLSPATFFSIKDNNRNGISELTLLTGFMSQGGHFYEVYEWNGEEFANLLPPYYPEHPNTKYLWVEATGKIYYEDIDRDFVQELILDSGIPVWETYYAGLPWRNERTYYKWNGQNYVPYKKEFASPEFRFQAIQDGDLATSQNEFDKALKLYQEAISNNKLNSYSPEIRENLRAMWDSRFGKNPSPTPYPANIDEYPKLAAYAYYRIMLIHLVLGQESEANASYNTLQQKFGGDPYDQPYVEMATAFWETYQSTHKMYDGCAAAIQYAAEHPEILVPLGSDYHGWQSHIYVPADVCPFR